MGNDTRPTPAETGEPTLSGVKRQVALALVAFALLLLPALAQIPTPPSSDLLTPAERDRVHARGGDLTGCDPIERKIDHGQEVVRYTCEQRGSGIPPNADRPVEHWRVYIATGAFKQETKPTFVARLKSVGTVVVAGIVLAVLIYAKAQQ